LPSIILLPDGTRIPTTFEEAQNAFGNFPVAKTPEELAKIQSHRMAGSHTVDDDERERNDEENAST